MGLRSIEGVPHKGWQLVEVVDLHDDEGLSYGEYEDCQFCDHEQIRFVHILVHQEYDEDIRVGCICSCYLTNDYVEPKRQERVARNKAARRARFPHRRAWKANKQGGKTISLDGFRITVGLKREKYRCWINGLEGSQYHDAERTAMLRAYDYVQFKRTGENRKPGGKSSRRAISASSARGSE